jgi:hypothetical protein
VRGGAAVERRTRARGERGIDVHADQAQAASTAPAATPASQSICSGSMT